jgi:hypothetical protein
MDAQFDKADTDHDGNPRCQRVGAIAKELSTGEQINCVARRFPVGRKKRQATTEALAHPLSEMELRCDLPDPRIGGVQNLTEGRISDVPVDRSIRIELRVIEDVEHLQSQFK